MSQLSINHFPRRGDKVNDKRRIPFANGFVVRVLYDDGPDTVIVQFDNGKELYDFEDFRSKWTDHYGGAFELANPVPSSAEQIEQLLKALGL